MVLGEDVSSIETMLQLVGVSLNEGLHPQQEIIVRSQYHKNDRKPAGQSSTPLDGGSRLAQGSAADLDSLNQGAGIFEGHGQIPQQDLVQQDGSSSKRKRVDSRSDTELHTEYTPRGEAPEKCRSRDQMPPPAIPIQQPFAFRARVPFTDSHNLNFQHNQVHARHFPVTPQRHPYADGLGYSILAPDSSTEPSNMLSARIRANSEQSHVDHHQAPRATTGTAGPVCMRGGWQPPPQSFDTERSGYFSSPNLSLPSTAQPPLWRAMRDRQGSLMFPIELEDRTIDPSSRSYQSVSSDGPSSYHRKQLVPAMQSQPKSPTHSGIRDPSPYREGRITLSRVPSVASRHSPNKSIGIFSHVRSSSCQTNHELTASSSHHQQLITTTREQQRLTPSSRFSTRQPAYSISLPSLKGPRTQVFRNDNSFESGPTLLNGEMRPYSSNNSEFLSLAHNSRMAQTGIRPSLIESQASGPRRRANR